MGLDLVEHLDERQIANAEERHGHRAALRGALPPMHPLCEAFICSTAEDDGNWAPVAVEQIEGCGRPQFAHSGQGLFAVHLVERVGRIQEDRAPWVLFF